MEFGAGPFRPFPRFETDQNQVENTHEKGPYSPVTDFWNQGRYSGPFRGNRAFQGLF